MNYKPKSKVDFKLPPNLNYLIFLTDKNGIIQHAKFNSPALEHGYSIDDQSRALIVVTKFLDCFGNGVGRGIQKIYLNYIKNAQMENGLYNNFMSDEGIFSQHGRSEDSFGRVMWCLGQLYTSVNSKEFIDEISRIIDKSSRYISRLVDTRGWAYSLIGLVFLTDNSEGINLYHKQLIEVERKIVKKFKKEKDWQWFDDFLTYSNAIVPYSLLKSYSVSKDKKVLEIALDALDFLNTVSTVQGYPSPVGNNGWYFRGKQRAVYDQQVIDVTDMVLAFSEAYLITKDKRYLDRSLWWFDWFYGNNLKGLEMVVEESGAVYDGLTEYGRNQNRGAESVVCYLLAYLKLSELFLR